ncbi:tetratricopeptide repeat protein [Winogradskyella sp.]|uniref:tetratricopeptide repeat protein n=1 Tax=Winogradskyella sp. TaxID=1883156 RepID=UPI003AA9B321
MHWQAQQFISTVASCFSKNHFFESVLEVGAHVVNGSVRDTISSPLYLGVDLSSGDGVDIVCSGHQFSSSERFKLCISCECFEHNPYYLETFDNMIKHLSGDGLILFTCASTGRPEHGTTRTTPELSPGTTSINWDYYKNLVESDFSKSQNLKELDYYFFLTNEVSKDLYFVGAKGKAATHLKQKTSEIRQQTYFFESLSKEFNYNTVKIALKEYEFGPKTLIYIANTAPQILETKEFCENVEFWFYKTPNSMPLCHIMAKINSFDLDRALSLAARAFNSDRENAQYLLTLVELLEKSGKINCAIQLLIGNKIYLSRPSLSWKLTSLLLDSSEFEKALSVANESLDLYENNWGLWHCKLKSELKLKFNKQALDTATLIIRKNSIPNWLRGICNRVLDN